MHEVKDRPRPAALRHAIVSTAFYVLLTCLFVAAPTAQAIGAPASSGSIESIIRKSLPKAALQGKTGWIDANKFVFNMTGSGSPSGFAATVTCTGFQGTHSYPLTLHDMSASSIAANVGDTCTIVEALVSNSPGATNCPFSQQATWQAYYLPSATFTVSGANTTSLMILNVASCAKGNTGGLSVSALGIVNNTGGPWPTSVFSQIPYTIGTHVTCTPGGPTNTPLQLSASFPNFFSNTITNLTPGSQCSVVEDSPFPPVTNVPQCASGTAHWETSYSPATATIIANQFVSLQIIHTLVCDASNGSLTIIKKIVDLGNGTPPPPTPFTATVNCPTTITNQQVTLDPASNYQATISVPSNSACTVTENPPPQLSAYYLRKGCYWQQDPGNTTGIKSLRAKGDKTRYLTNDWICPKGGKDTGILDVIKKVVSETGAPPPPTVFYADVHCQPGGPDVTLELSSSNGFQNAATGIPFGSTCTVTEQTPSVPADFARKGCHWETEYTNGQKFNIGDVRANEAEIVNHWTCKGSGGKTGSLPVSKTVINDSSTPPPATVFIADVNCSPGGSTVGLELSSGNGFHNIASGLPFGSTCTVSERTPDVPPELARKGCHWETVYPNGQTFHIGDGREDPAKIENHWTCKGDGGKTGTLDVIKKIVNDSSVAPPPTVFYADVHCQPNGPDVTLELSSGNNFQNTATSIPFGSTCTVTEQTPPVPGDLARKGCHWETEYTNGQKFSLGDVRANEAEIVNHWICKGDKTGTFTIIKKVVSDGQIPAPDVNFVMDVNCTPGGAQPAVTLNSTNNWQQTISVPGATCSVTEEPPVVPAEYARRGCHWETDGSTGTGSNGGPRTMAVGDKKTRTITNHWICKGDKGTGHLSLFKTVVNATGGPVSMPSTFDLTAHCGVLNPTAPVPANSGVSLATAIAAGTTCTVTEAQLPNIDRLKQCKGRPAVWTTTYSPAVTISSGGNATLTVTNTLNCDKGGPGDGDGGYDLGLAKACSPCATTTGGTVNFTLTGTSYGDGVGQGAVQIVDTLPAGLVPTNASGSGWSCSISGQTVTCNYVGPGVGNGQTFVPITIATTAGSAGTYDNSAVINFVGGYEGNLSNNTAHATVVVRKGGDTGTKYDAGIVKTADGTWVSGNAAVFRLVVTNYGAAVPGGTISVTDTLPPGMTLVGGAGSGWSCGSSNPVTCTYSGSAGQGQTLPPLLITVTLSEMGHATNTAVVSMSGVSDSVPNNNTSTITVNVSPPALSGNGGNGGTGGTPRSAGKTNDVGLTNTVTNNVVVGDWDGDGTLDLTVTNYGGSLEESANLMLYDTLPSGLTLVSAIPEGGWTCRTSGNNVTCRLMGLIPSGMLPKVRVKARATGKGTFNNCASVELIAVKDGNPSNNRSCATLRFGLDQPKSIPQPPSLIVPPPPAPKHKGAPPPPPPPPKGGKGP